MVKMDNVLIEFVHLATDESISLQNSLMKNFEILALVNKQI